MAKKILVIDDSALMRRVISDIINEGNEYEVAAIAKDGLEGFDLIVSNPNLYSAIILDINMPKMNGLELLQKLQKNHIEQTVIVVSTVAKEGAKETIQAMSWFRRTRRISEPTSTCATAKPAKASSLRRAPSS